MASLLFIYNGDFPGSDIHSIVDPDRSFWHIYCSIFPRASID